MTSTDLFRPTTTTAADEHATLLVALELSRSSWLVAVSAPGADRVSRYDVAAGNSAALVAQELKRAERANERPMRVVTIHGGQVRRLLAASAARAKGIESHVVDAASVAVNRRQRRAKTDRIDLDMLLRTLAAFRRGERRVCSMVHPPSPADEDRRRAGRERQRLITEKTQHLNRIKGLLATQGIAGYAPARGDRRARLEELHTGDGRVLPARRKQEFLC